MISIHTMYKSVASKILLNHFIGEAGKLLLLGERTKNIVFAVRS